MKQLVAGLLCVLMLFLVPLNANAEEAGSFENAEALYEYWSKNGIPNYITGVWSSDGGYTNLTFGVTNDETGRDGAKQILALVTDDSTITIAYQTYSLNYLYEIQAEIEKYMEDDIGFKSVGAYFSTNRIEVDVDQEKIDNPETNAVISAFTEKYGNAVFFKFTNAQYIFVSGSANGPATGSYNQIINPINKQPSSNMPLLFTMTALSVACLVALFFSEYKRRKLLILLTNSGTVAIPQGKPSYRAIENAVKEASSTPSFETDAGVRNAILHSSEK